MGLDREVVWWWKTLWKIKCPPKNKLFMWFVLENKAPTWDNLQKRSFQGPSWCSLCKGESKSVIHLFLHCSYTLAVWKECKKHFGIKYVWRGYTILLACKREVSRVRVGIHCVKGNMNLSYTSFSIAHTPWRYGRNAQNTLA